jgi:uroporphyrinogen-III synthase
MWMHTLYCILLLFLTIDSFRLPTVTRLVALKRRNTSFQAVKVALTREKDTNGKLASLLNGLQCVELPCIEFSKTEEFDALQDYIPKCDMILLTSPQSSEVFLESWKNIGSPPVKVVSIGKGTSKPLVSEGIEPVFEPSDATGSTLAAELPDTIGKTILYPVSALADSNLQSELTKRGFEV